MKIQDKTIIFKSHPSYYEREVSGKKPNTVRTLKKIEQFELDHVWHTLTHIKIINTDTQESFTRELSDISCTFVKGQDEIFNNPEIKISIFSWKHEGGVC